jgi:hypothetical protein
MEAVFSDVEKLQKNQEQNMTNKVNIEFTQKQLEKLLTDVEKLKDKVRANGSYAHNEETEVVIALLMLVNGEIKEGTYTDWYAECIKGARIAKRGLKINSGMLNIQYA